MKILILIIAVALIIIFAITVITASNRDKDAEIARLRKRLSLSGNHFYMDDISLVKKKYLEACISRDEAFAQIAGLAKQIEVLTAIIDRYIGSMSLSSLESAHGITHSHSDRDSETGKFIPGNDETEPKAVRAYRMDVEDMGKEVIADRLDISVSSVRKYISDGRKALAEKTTEVFDGEKYRKMPSDFVNEEGKLYRPDMLEKYENGWDLEHHHKYGEVCQLWKGENNVQ